MCDSCYYLSFFFISLEGGEVSVELSPSAFRRRAEPPTHHLTYQSVPYEESIMQDQRITSCQAKTVF